jgi:hypothetical protein
MVSYTSHVTRRSDLLLTLCAFRNPHDESDEEQTEGDEDLVQQRLDQWVLDVGVGRGEESSGSLLDHEDEYGDDNDGNGLKDIASEEDHARGLMMWSAHHLESGIPVLTPVANIGSSSVMMALSAAAMKY